MKYLSIELRKTKRRGIWLVLAALYAVMMAWTAYTYTGSGRQHIVYGWRYTIYTAPLLNAIMIPTAIAVFASRIIDMEHKGNTWKLLETVQSKRTLYLAKILYGAIGVFLFSAAEFVGLLLMGVYFGFSGAPDLWAYGLFFVQTFIISFNLFLLQMIISLLFSNQAVAICVGLCGSTSSARQTFGSRKSMELPPSGRSFLASTGLRRCFS